MADVRQQLTEAEIARIAQAARAWVQSPEGRAAIERALREADEAVARLREARRIDAHEWHMPVCC